MTFGQIQMTEEDRVKIKTLNNVAVDYFGLGLQGVSYQIWDELYHGIQKNAGKDKGLLPIISCNMGNVLRRTGYFEEAYRVCVQGLKYCFWTDVSYGMPELVLQLAILCMELGETEQANALYLFGRTVFCWGRQASFKQTMEEMMEQDILLYCREGD